MTKHAMNHTQSNPPKHCPACRSILNVRRASGCDPDGTLWDGMELICPKCGAVEVEDPLAPDNEAEPIHVTTDSDDWTRCPCCGWRFCATKEQFFRFGRHRRCGQRLIITKSDAGTKQ